MDYIATKALSTLDHISLISIDFWKTFHRIGAHTILNQLIEWKVSKKIISYIKSFLRNTYIFAKKWDTHKVRYLLYNFNCFREIK